VEQKIGKGIVYCVDCGRKLKKPKGFSILFCPNGGAENHESDEFCLNCCTKLKNAALKDKLAEIPPL
jgi:predicted RNA-binding Zn-ribbon protein involved in translation (DUF1610 family)